MSMDARTTIKEGKAILGIEFGSTRIKAVMIDQYNKPIAQGAHEWENQLENGLWTYSIDAIWKGLQDCYADLQADVFRAAYAENKKTDLHKMRTQRLLRGDMRRCR